MKKHSLFTYSIFAIFFLLFWASCGEEETCIDSIQNQDETGVDCGGVCDACVSCSDGIQNGNETGVDCGGDCPNVCPIVTNLEAFTTLNSDLPDDYIYDLEFQGSVLWVATAEGAASYDGSAWTVYNTANSGLPNNEVRDILIRPNNTVWFATWGGGVAELDNGTWTVFNSLDPNSPNGIDFSSQLLTTFNWTVVGSQGTGYHIWDGTSWTSYTPANSGLTSDQITGIANGVSFDLFISTLDEGLLRFNSPSFEGWNSVNSNLPDNELYSVHHVGNGDHWLGTKAGLVYKSGDNFTTYAMANSDIRGDVVKTLGIDENDQIWMNAGGLSYYDSVNDTWTHFTEANSSFDLAFANAFIKDVNGTVWVGTQERGLLRFELVE